MNTLLTTTVLNSSLLRGLKFANPVRIARKLRDDEGGVAAIEFAIIAPIMIAMYFGLAEIASAISVDRRVSHSTNVAGDLITQQPEVRDGNIEEVVSAALRVLGVSDISRVSMDIESFILPAAGGAPESRGRIRLNASRTGFAGFDASALDSKILNENSGVVVTRLSYRYTPLKLKFFDTDLTLRETFMLKPRRSDAVQIQDGMDNLIDCSATSYSDVTCTVTTN